MGVTVFLATVWQRCVMGVGVQSQMLRVPDALRVCLVETGQKGHFPAANTLFREGSDNAGVFLVMKGRVCMSMKSMPRLDRIFGSWSLLGLPSSFTGRPYSLTATAVTETNVAQVPREDFLRLMRERPDLCCEAMGILAREMSFIQSALVERQRTNASETTCRDDVAVG